MYHTPSKDWLRKKRTGKESWNVSSSRAPAIGRFFEDVAGEILDAERTPRDSIGDLYVPEKSGTYRLVEVKSFGHSNGGLRIPDLQFDLCRGEVGFHITKLHYAAFQWKNTDWDGVNRRPHSVLKRCKGADQCARAIIPRTERLYLMDPALITAIRETHGSRLGLLANPTEACTLVTGLIFKNLNSDPKATLSSLGLRYRDWSLEHRSLSIPFDQDENNDSKQAELDLKLDLTMNLNVMEIRRKKTPPLLTRIPDQPKPIKIRSGKIIRDEPVDLQQELPLQL